jgi:hypothetical protein
MLVEEERAPLMEKPAPRPLLLSSVTLPEEATRL